MEKIIVKEGIDIGSVGRPVFLVAGKQDDKEYFTERLLLYKKLDNEEYFFRHAERINFNSVRYIYDDLDNVMEEFGENFLKSTVRYDIYKNNQANNQFYNYNIYNNLVYHEYNVRQKLFEIISYQNNLLDKILTQSKHNQLKEYIKLAKDNYKHFNPISLL